MHVDPPHRQSRSALFFGVVVVAVTAVVVGLSLALGWGSVGPQPVAEPSASEVEEPDRLKRSWDVTVRLVDGDVNLATSVVPLDVADDLFAVEGVVAVQPRVSEIDVVPFGGTGEKVVAAGRNFGVNWEARTPNPRMFMVRGSEPTKRGEFVIDAKAFDVGEFVIGDSYRIEAPNRTEEMKLVGAFVFGSWQQTGQGGAIMLAFEEQQALTFLNAGLGYDDISVVLDSEGDRSALIDDLNDMLAESWPTVRATDQRARMEALTGSGN